MRKVKVAVAQPTKEVGVLDIAEEYICRACTQGTYMIFFPEFFLQRDDDPISLEDDLVQTLENIAS